MTTGQVDYPLRPDVGRPGMLADGGPHDIISAYVLTAAGIGVGRGVKRGAGSTFAKPLCDVFSGSTDPNKMLGITVLDFTKEPVGVPEFPQYSTVGLLRKGRIFLTCSDDMRAASGTELFRLHRRGCGTSGGRRFQRDPHPRGGLSHRRQHR
jgi:hypothetical protein